MILLAELEHQAAVNLLATDVLLPAALLSERCQAVALGAPGLYAGCSVDWKIEPYAHRN